MREKQSNVEIVEIDLGEILGLLLHRLWIIILCGVICGGIGLAVSAFAITPQYESTTKIYILNKQNSDTLTYSDAQLATQLTKDYEELVTSRTVLEAIIDTFYLEDTYEDMVKRVSVQNTSDTRIIAITVRDPDPILAQNICNGIRDAAAEHIQSVMDIEAVNIVDVANLPGKPASPSIPIWTAVMGLLGIFVSTAILILRYMADDTIKSSEDIEKYLELSTLALIPSMEDGKENKKEKKKAKKKKKGISLLRKAEIEILDVEQL